MDSSSDVRNLRLVFGFCVFSLLIILSKGSLRKMADGVRASSKRTRGLYVQMHNASSSDLV